MGDNTVLNSTMDHPSQERTRDGVKKHQRDGEEEQHIGENTKVKIANQEAQNTEEQQTRKNHPLPHNKLQEGIDIHSRGSESRRRRTGGKGKEGRKGRKGGRKEGRGGKEEKKEKEKEKERKRKEKKRKEKKRKEGGLQPPKEARGVEIFLYDKTKKQ